MLQSVSTQQNSESVFVNYTKKEIENLDAIKGMKDECCICMEKHSINKVIEGKCGHQMGKSCFQEWANKSKGHVYCPLCRGNCDTVWELKLKERLFCFTNPLREPKRVRKREIAVPPPLPRGNLLKNPVFCCANPLKEPRVRQRGPSVLPLRASEASPLVISVGKL